MRQVWFRCPDRRGEEGEGEEKRGFFVFSSHVSVLPGCIHTLYGTTLHLQSRSLFLFGIFYSISRYMRPRGPWQRRWDFLQAFSQIPPRISPITDCHSFFPRDRHGQRLLQRGKDSTLLSAACRDDRSQVPIYHHQLGCHGWFCFESCIFIPLHGARRAMEAALPLSLRGQRRHFRGISARPGPAWAVIMGLPPSCPKRKRQRKGTPENPRSPHPPSSAGGLLLHGPLDLDLRQHLDLLLALLRHRALGGLP